MSGVWMLPVMCASLCTAPAYARTMSLCLPRSRCHNAAVASHFARLIKSVIITNITILLIVCSPLPQATVGQPLDIISTDEFSIHSGKYIELCNINRDHDQTSTLLFSLKTSSFIRQIESKDQYTRLLTLEDESSIDFTLEDIGRANVRRFSFEWHIPMKFTKVPHQEVCFHYTYHDIFHGNQEVNVSWYSTYQGEHVRWPMDPQSNDAHPSQFNCLNYVKNRNEEFQYIVENLFLNTDGFALIFESTLPLFIRKGFSELNEPVMCVSVNNEYPYLSTKVPKFHQNLKFHIFGGKNIKAVTQYVINNSSLIPRPRAIPDESKFANPTFQSWPQYEKMNRNQLETYASNLLKFGFLNAEIQLLSKWRNDYWRDFRFEPYLFWSAAEMIAGLHKQGFRLSLSVNQLPNQDSVGRWNGWKRFFTRNHALQFREFNFTNPNLADWFGGMLNETKSRYGFDSYVITPYTNICGMFPADPNSNVRKYMQIVSEAGGTQVSSMWAVRAQHLPVFTQLYLQGLSHQELLQRMIPNVLSVSIAGYSFLSSFPIGYPNYEEGEKPSVELYIRWVQAAAFLPGMTFAVPPWQYTNQTLHQLTRKYVNFHSQRVPILMNLARKRITTGDPIIRPMWYIAPNDHRAYSIDDQFMVGEDIIVAPVLREGQRSRVVYFPEGRWLDQHGNEYNGSSQVEVTVPLEELPFFIRPCGIPVAKNLARSSFGPIDSVLSLFQGWSKSRPSSTQANHRTTEMCFQ